MEEDLVRDEVVIEKQTYRDQLSSDLKKIKSELDRIREKLRLSQARDNADILQLDKLSQVFEVLFRLQHKVFLL